MSMQPQDIPEIPHDTFEVAQAVFPKGNLYLQMREQLGIIATVLTVAIPITIKSAVSMILAIDRVDRLAIASHKCC